MSILNGKISGDIMFQETPPYGRKIVENAFIPLTGCMDVAFIDEKHLVAACYQELKVFDVSGEKPELLSTLGGLGASRQLAFSNGFAYITARADGLYVCDLRDLRNPTLSAHVDTLELATGVAAVDGLLCVTNRHMGVEIWDTSNPAKPTFVSDFLAGEAQSVYLDGNIAYVGDWMNKTVHIHSLTDPCRPIELSAFSVDGFADGVFVHDGICYVATGHHSAKLKNRIKYNGYRFLLPEMLTDGYGCGHGFELFDVFDPSSPEFLSSVKLPPFFGGFDTWRISSDGRNAYICDTHNGFFVADVSSPVKPFLIGYFRLSEQKREMDNNPPSIQQFCKPVCGSAVTDGKIFLAGPDSGLHVLDFPEAKRLSIKSIKTDTRMDCKAIHENSVSKSFFSCGAQVHTVAFSTDTLFAACAEYGLCAINPSDGRMISHIITRGLCHDVQCENNLIYTAEGQSGIAVYSYSSENGLSEIDRAYFEGKSTREIVVSSKKIYVELGDNQIALVAMEDGRLVRKATASGLGSLYHRHMCRELVAGKLCICPLNVGPALIDTEPYILNYSGVSYGSEVCPIEEGVVTYEDGLILVIGRKYLYLENINELDRLDRTRFVHVKGARLSGIPFICGNRLAILNRCDGIIEMLDITNPKAPIFIERMVFARHPEYITEHGGYTWVASGHEGIFKI